MACTDYTSYGDFLVNGQFMDAIICPFSDQLGFLVFSMMVYVAIAASLYIYTGGVTVPLIVSILVGAIVIVNLPSIAVKLAVIVALLVVTIGVYLLVRRAEGAV